MAVFNCLQFYLHALCCLLLTEFAFAARRYNLVDTKFIEDVCPYNDTLELFLSPTGMQSAIRIRNMLTKGNSNCTIIIYSSQTGVIVNLDAGPYKAGHTYEGCEDYIQLLPNSLNGKNCTKPSSLVSEGKVTFRYFKKYSEYLERSCTIISTAYRKGNGLCSADEFMCGTGECIWKDFQCDGMLNCPDGSDEYGPKSQMCINMPPPLTLKAIDFDWNAVFPTSKSLLEYKKSFNVTITAAVACAFLIFFFGVIRFVCHYHSSKRNLRNRNRNPTTSPRCHATIRTFSVIRQRPDYRPEEDCPPPPSYVSLIEQNADMANMNPPDYSTVADCKVDDGSTCDENKKLKGNIVPGPPPPYVP